MIPDSLKDEAGALLDEAIRVRREIHERPELDLHNPRTQELVMEELSSMGFDDLQTGQDCSSVVTTLQGDRDGPTILLRADTDALPMPEDTGLNFASRVDGAMHACGHDAHTAMLLGAARLLMGRRRGIAGKVVFAFQPGEEGHGGAAVMLREGLIEKNGAEAAFAIHQTPTVPSGWLVTKPGPILASADEFTITIRGRGGHASQPHDALDPIPVACELVQAMQTMVTRKVDAFNPAVVTVARITAGTTSNVIPECAEIEGTVRSVSERTRALVLENIRRLAEGIASAHGATAELEFPGGYPVTVNDDGFAAFAADVCRKVVSDSFVPMPSPAMGAEDFSYILQKVPGAMVFLGTHPGGDGPVAPNHSNRMVIDESAMATGIALHAAIALEFLGQQHPSLSR